MAALLQQGLFHHQRGEVAPAMEHYTEVLRIDPRNPDALYYIAVIACQDGQFKQGIDACPPLAPVGRAQARAHNLIGQALHRLGQLKEALASFDDALACDVNFADAYGNRANMLSELGRPTEALSSFDRALALNPKSDMDWLNRGATLPGLGRPDEAIESYDRAIALEPKFPVPHINRANALCETGRVDEALAGYDKTIALAAEFADAHPDRAPRCSARPARGGAGQRRPRRRPQAGAGRRA